MAFSLSAIFFKFCCTIVFVSMALQTTAAQGSRSCDVVNNTCPMQNLSTSESAPTVSATTTDETTPSESTWSLTTPYSRRSTTGEFTGTTDSSLNSARMWSSTTPPPPICCNCSTNCKQCFGEGVNDCLVCDEGYVIKESEGNVESCLPCSNDCYYACNGASDMCSCVRNKCSCNLPKNLKHGSCEKETILDILTIPGLVGIGVGAFVIVAIITIICCCKCRRRPPEPVKKDYGGQVSYTQHEHRRSLANANTDADEENGLAFVNQTVDDDVYKNVDIRGNMLRINMPEQEQEPAEIEPHRPSRRAPAPPMMNKVQMEPQSDFGDVYNNIAIEEPPTRPPMPPPKPDTGPSDFGGVYGNAEIPQDAPSTNQKFQLKKTGPTVFEMPPLPGKKFTQESSQEETRPPPALPLKSPLMIPVNRTEVPQLPVFARPPKISESEEADLPMRNAPLVFPHPPVPSVSEEEDLPKRAPPPVFAKLPGPSLSEQENMPTRAPPPPPGKFSSLGANVMLSRGPPPTPTKKSSSLPQQARAPPPVLPNKKQKKKPIVRHIDEEDIRGGVEVGQSPPPRPIKAPPTDVYGGDYEVTEIEPQQDHGMMYEVMEDALAPPAPPQQDYGENYEPVEPPPRPEEQDFGDTYEPVEAPEEEEDFGGDYEFVALPKPQKPQTPAPDISARKPMPLPVKVHPPPTKRKPSRVEVYEDADKPSQRGWNHPPQNNNSNTTTELSFGDEVHKLPSRPPPAIPKKQPNPQTAKSMYQQALQFSEDEKEVKLFQEVEDDSIYQNNMPVSRYRNVPQKPGENPVVTGNYIKMQRN